MSPMQHRIATLADAPVLAAMNRDLAVDEQHRNASRSLEWFTNRMLDWLSGEWQAMVFTDDTGPVGYAIWRESEDGIYLRQFFVRRDRRRQGIGRGALRTLLREVWPSDRRLTVEALVDNHDAIAFWHAAGFRDYCLTLEMPAGERPQ